MRELITRPKSAAASLRQPVFRASPWKGVIARLLSGLYRLGRVRLAKGLLGIYSIANF
jgi:hypothetical protein